MSSSGPIRIKKRRTKGSCDLCRQKKIRCDSATRPGNLCSNCLAFGSECTHIHATSKLKGKKGMPTAKLDMQDSVQNKVAAILAQNPFVLPEDLAVVRHTMVEMAYYIKSLEDQLASSRSSSFLDSASGSGEGYDSDDLAVAEHMQQLTLEQSECPYSGRSGALTPAKTIAQLKRRYMGLTGPIVLDKRAEYTALHSWQWLDSEPTPLVFPEQDLMLHLIDLYFCHVNVLFPVFHRPTFENLILQCQHSRQYQLGNIVLAMCAVACRYCTDPRVFHEAAGTEENSGWKWFSQVRPIRRSLTIAPSIWELQLYCVCILYLQGTGRPDTCRDLIALGIRCAEDAGAHKKMPGEIKRTTQSELWKRAFWVLISMDIHISTVFGRPRSSHPENYDQELPAECDEEYWNPLDPEQAFRQPSNKPSTLSYWTAYLKLLSILGCAQQSVCRVGSVGLMQEKVSISEDQILSQIDVALMNWLRDIPEHLKWNLSANSQNRTFLDQSAMLYSTYYYTQFWIHKSFVTSPSSNAKPRTSFPSLAICANAARACIHILDVHTKRSSKPLAMTSLSIASAALLLVLNYWRGYLAGLSPSPHREFRDVHVCMRILQQWEARWQAAGRLHDVLDQLIAGLEVSALVTTSDDPVITLPFSTQELGKLPVLRAFRLVDIDTRSNEMSDILQSTDATQPAAGMNDCSYMLDLNGLANYLEFSWENWLMASEST